MPESPKVVHRQPRVASVTGTGRLSTPPDLAGWALANPYANTWHYFLKNATRSVCRNVRRDGRTRSSLPRGAQFCDRCGSRGAAATAHQLTVRAVKRKRVSGVCSCLKWSATGNRSQIAAGHAIHLQEVIGA
jgi:hypothetical protein